MTIELLGEPKSTSHIYHYHCKFGRPSGYMTADGRKIKESYQWQIKGQYHGKPLAEPLRIAATLFFGTKRVHDVDNYGKLLLDACTGLLWDDDGQIVEMTVRKDYDKARPRIALTIETYEG
jgi:Holliday junction resolvase RusA-like endonuclease